MVWTSVDGIAWAETTDLAEMDPVTAMGPSPSGLVAFGSRFSPELGDLELIAATSADGIHFGRVDAPALPATTIQARCIGSGGRRRCGRWRRPRPELLRRGAALDRRPFVDSGRGLRRLFRGERHRPCTQCPTAYVALGIVPSPDDFGVATARPGFPRMGSTGAPSRRHWRDVQPASTHGRGPTGIVAFHGHRRATRRTDRHQHHRSLVRPHRGIDRDLAVPLRGHSTAASQALPRSRVCNWRMDTNAAPSDPKDQFLIPPITVVYISSGPLPPRSNRRRRDDAFRERLGWWAWRSCRPRLPPPRPLG